MKKISTRKISTKTLSRLALLSLFTVTLGSVLAIPATPAQAQRCRAYEGDHTLTAGSKAALGNRRSPTGSRINIRSGPSLNDNIQHYGLAGDRITVLSIRGQSDCFRWFYIEFPQSGARGWVRGDLIAGY